MGERRAGDVQTGVRVRLHLLFPFPCLDDVLPQLGGSVLAVDLEVESTGVAHGHVLLDSSPQRGCCCRAVGARCPLWSRFARVAPLTGRPGQGSGSPVHLVVEPASVAQVVPAGVSPPERG